MNELSGSTVCPHVEEYREVLEFWFGDTGVDEPTAEDSKRWFMGGSELDAEIKLRFEALLQKPVQHWLGSARGSLAYVIVHDQFPLNIYRRQAQAFAFETKAEQACLHSIECGFDRVLGLGERTFLYMPLMHAENLELQNLGVQKFQEFADELEGPRRERVLSNVRFAQEHQETIAKYGRFPFRNEVLGRQSTEQEMAYLNDGAPRYGQ